MAIAALYAGQLNESAHPHECESDLRPWEDC